MNSSFSTFYSLIPRFLKYSYILIILLFLSYAISYFFWSYRGVNFESKQNVSISIYPIEDNSLDILSNINKLNLLINYLKSSNELKDLSFAPIIINSKSLFEKFSYYYKQENTIIDSLKEKYQISNDLLIEKSENFNLVFDDVKIKAKIKTTTNNFEKDIEVFDNSINKTSDIVKNDILSQINETIYRTKLIAEYVDNKNLDDLINKYKRLEDYIYTLKVNFDYAEKNNIINDNYGKSEVNLLSLLLQPKSEDQNITDNYSLEHYLKGTDRLKAEINFYNSLKDRMEKNIKSIKGGGGNDLDNFGNLISLKVESEINKIIEKDFYKKFNDFRVIKYNKNYIKVENVKDYTLIKFFLTPFIISIILYIMMVILILDYVSFRKKI